MANRENTFIEITPDVLLKAYACGIFPMAESADDPALYWIEPDMRGVIPLQGFHIPARLARTVRSTRYTVHIDRDFDAVVEGCAEPKQDRSRTWINIRIRRIYRSLFDRGHCHTVEVYDGDQLVGGLYGVSLGRAFSARVCSIAYATPRRLRLCISSHASSWAVTGCSTLNMLPST
jgi:leucyl/phenylalanyl-tRNA--protein transferase